MNLHSPDGVFVVERDEEKNNRTQMTTPSAGKRRKKMINTDLFFGGLCVESQRALRETFLAENHKAIAKE
ncbi:MAG: hypothetical protein U5K00_08040 [Melioribacteraceae bacterium]|nr:hypothetical protein [Melioribacteraceae bacterium]